MSTSTHTSTSTGSGETAKLLARAERMLAWWEQQHPDEYPPFAVTATPRDELDVLVAELPEDLRQKGQALLHYFNTTPSDPAAAFSQAAYCAQQLVRVLGRTYDALVVAQTVQRAAHEDDLPVAMVLNTMRSR